MKCSFPPLFQSLIRNSKGLWVLFAVLAVIPIVQAQSLQLTGSVQWVNIGDLDITGNQITVEALIYRQSGVNVVSKHTDPSNVNYLLRPTTFEITTTSQFYLMNNPYTIQNNTWYHIAGVYNGSTISYYVNGCLVIQQAATGNIVTNNLATAIGNISTSPYAEQFIGYIDEVRIWNTARTQAQIAANMNDLPNPNTYPNLRGYYKFSNNLLNSGNSGTNNGTAQGAISYGPDAPIIQQLSIVSVAPVNSTCFGANNGSVTITASGSGVQYSINGTTYQAGNTFTGLTPGNYTAYIRSAEGCVVTQAFSITQPAQLTSTTNATICSNQTYSFAGNTYNTAGTYNVVLPGSGGCDSTATLTLSVIPATGTAPAASTFNTATNGAGGTLPGGSNDATWKVAVNNINGPYNPAIVMTNTSSYYSSPWPDCNWISHSAGGNHSGNVDFFYQAQFALPCFNNCGQSYADDGVFCLSLDFFADNSVYEIYVNGVPQSPNIPGMPVSNPYSNVGFNQAGMVSATLCRDWQPGLNTLTIEVRSGSPLAGFLAQTSINGQQQSATDTVNAQICAGQTYSFGGNTYSSTGNYNHTFQTINGCDSIVTLSLHVTAPPAQPGITSNSPVCEGSTLQLNTPTVNNATYTWNGPNSWTSSSQNPTRPNSTVSMSGTYTLTVSVNGCSSPSGSTNLVVNPIPDTPTVNMTTPLCEGATLFFSAPATIGAQYYWSGPNAWTANTQTGQIPGVTVSQSGNYSLYIVQNGCTSATTTKAVVINPKPDVSYTGSLSFCGTEAALSANANIGAGNISSYLWYAQNVATPFGAGASLVNDFTGVSPTAQQVISVVAGSNMGCNDTATVTLHFFATPNAQFDWEDLCNGTTLQFTENANWNGNPGMGATTLYSWDFGDFQTGTGASPTHLYADSGSYTVTLVVGSTESTCTDTVTADVYLHALPKITLTIMPPPCGQNVSFNAHVKPSSVIQTTNWDFGDAATGSDTATSHNYQQPGTYNIVFTLNTNYSCTFTAAEQLVVQPSPSINTVPIPNIITPNGDPINEELSLDNLLADCVEYEMKIYNRWGNLIYKQTKGSPPFSGKGMFNVKVSPGVYFYVIQSGSDEKSGTITVVY